MQNRNPRIVTSLWLLPSPEKIYLSIVQRFCLPYDSVLAIQSGQGPCANTSILRAFTMT
jgi:hypothetical protein